MLLYNALGDMGGVRAAYLAHRRAMREDLDADPDPDIVDLYETLTHP